MMTPIATPTPPPSYFARLVAVVALLFAHVGTGQVPTTTSSSSTNSSLVIIPCSEAGMTSSSLESYTTYLLDGCTSPVYEGGGTSHLLAAFLTFAQPNLVQVRILVRGGSVLPIVRISSGDSTSHFTAINISVTIVGVRAAWPIAVRGLPWTTVDSILSVRKVSYSNVTLELQSCTLTSPVVAVASSSSSSSMSALPFAPMLLLSPPSGAQPASSGLSITIVHSNLTVVLCSECSTSAGDNQLFLVDNSVQGVDILVSNSTILLQTAMSNISRRKSVAIFRFESEAEERETISDVQVRVTTSTITCVALVANPAVGYEAVVAVLSIVTGMLSNMILELGSGCTLKVSLLASLQVVPTDFLMSASVLAMRVTAFVESVTLRCEDTSVQLLSAMSGSLFRIRSRNDARSIHIVVFKVNQVAEVTPGPVGRAGKTTSCIDIAASRTLRDVYIAMDSSRMRMGAAADRTTQSVVSAISLVSLMNATNVSIQLRRVVLIADLQGDVSPIGVVAGSSVISFLGQAMLFTVVGIKREVTVTATSSTLRIVASYNVAKATQAFAVLARSTGLLAALVLLPAFSLNCVVTIDGCDLVVDVGDNGGEFGLVPALTAAEASSGYWDSGFVGVLSFQKPDTLFGGISQQLADLILANYGEDGDAIRGVASFSSEIGLTTVTIRNTTVSSTASPSASSSFTNMLVAMVILQNTSLRAVRINISRVVAFGQRPASSTQRPILQLTACPTQRSNTFGAFVSVVGVVGDVHLQGGTRITASLVDEVLGPLIGGHSVVKSGSLTLSIDANASVEFHNVVVRAAGSGGGGVLEGGSVVGVSPSVVSSKVFTVTVASRSTVASSQMMPTDSAIRLTASSLCGYGYLTDDGVRVTTLPSPDVPHASPFIIGLWCNVWFPSRISDVLLASADRIGAALVATVNPGTDWDPTCPPRPVMSVSRLEDTVTQTFPVPPPSHSSPSAGGASSVIMGVTIAVGVLLGTSGAQGMHGIQAAMTILRVKTLCDQPSGSSATDAPDRATPSDLCCDLASSPTQLALHFDDDGSASGSRSNSGTYLGAVIGNTALIFVATTLRFVAGRCVSRCIVAPDTSAISKARSPLSAIVARLLATMAPPSGAVTLCWTGYTSLLCPTVSLCVALAADAAMPHYARWVAGLLILPLWLVPWAGAIRGLLWWRGRRVVFQFKSAHVNDGSGVVAESNKKRTVRERRLRAQQQSSVSLRWLLEPSEELVPRRRADHGAASEQLRLFGSVFSGFKASRFWYFNCEVGFAWATGVATGLLMWETTTLDEGNACAGLLWAWVVVGLGVAEATVSIALRSFALRLELMMMIVVMALTIASEVIVLVSSDTASSNVLCVAAATLQNVMLLHGAFEHLGLRRRIAATERAARAPSAPVLGLDVAESPISARRLSSQSRLTQSTSDVTSSTTYGPLETLVNMICDAKSAHHGALELLL